jgi:hypothetical protein
MPVIHVTETRPTRWHTRREITFCPPPGACRTPIRVTVGDTVTWIACERRLPERRQCSACRIRIIIEPTPTVGDLGDQSDSGGGR